MGEIWEYYELGHAFESRAATFFNLARGFRVLIRAIISEFYMAWRKYLLIGGGTFVPPPCPYGVDIAYVQTGLIKNFFF